MKILITGGSGYFGQGFVKHLLANDLASRICIYSRGEFTQATMRQELNDDDRLRWMIGDVRDRDRLTHAMEGCDVVVHAAALKRIEVCEYNALECVATNVHGTENVVKSAIAAGVKKAVLLSTDKACEPCNTYGLSKAMAEKIFLTASHYAGATGPKFLVTRYGNVAGSTGSVIHYWRSLLQKQDWLPVTDLEATRFWMTRQEAVDLVLEAIYSGEPGSLLIPDLPAYQLKDLAIAMNPMHKPRVVGMRPGEKRHESMTPGATSEFAQRMGIGELREALQHVE